MRPRTTFIYHAQRAAYRATFMALLMASMPVLLWRCGTGESQNPAGTLEIRVKDHRNAIDDFKELALTIGALRLSPDASLKSTDPGWIELVPKVDHFDLTQYKGGDSLLIYKAEPSSQHFEAIDLKISKTRGVLAKTAAPAKVENNVRPIRLQFATEPGRTVVVTLDLEVLDLSDHPGRGYDLRVRGYELFANGELLEKVPPG